MSLFSKKGVTVLHFFALEVQFTVPSLVEFGCIRFQDALMQVLKYIITTGVILLFCDVFQWGKRILLFQTVWSCLLLQEKRHFSDAVQENSATYSGETKV